MNEIKSFGDRFIGYGHNEILDASTGLIWLKTHFTIEMVTWKDAIGYIKDSKWNIPSKAMFKTLICSDNNDNIKILNDNGFDLSRGCYWATDISHSCNGNNHIRVSLLDGTVTTVHDTDSIAYIIGVMNE